MSVTAEVNTLTPRRLVGQSRHWLPPISATGIDQVTVAESASLPAISIYSSAMPSSVLAQALVARVLGKTRGRLHDEIQA